MLIRSQDRKILTEVHDLYIDDVNQIWNGLLLGKYSSEEKALKVLDEIQKRTEYLYPKAFQMPQDEDVEV